MATASSGSPSVRTRPVSRSTTKSCAGCEAAHPRDLARGRREDPRLRAEADPAVAGDHPAAGAQAVAVEHRAERVAVAEGDRRPGRPTARRGASGSGRSPRAPPGRRRGPPRRPGSSSSSRDAASGRRAPSARTRGRTRPSRRPPSSISGRQSARSSPNASEESTASRARIQLTLPRTVLISPLWAIIRSGCASSQLGAVFVEKREWTIANVLRSDEVAEVGVELRQLRRRQHPLVDDRPAGHAREEDVVRRTRARRGAGPRTGCGRTRPRPSTSSPASMKSWLICGADSRASWPHEVSSTGTWRQPIGPWPASATSSLDAAADPLGAADASRGA